MKKKIKDLTLEELIKLFCDNSRDEDICSHCPLCHGCVGYLRLGTQALETELEVDD